MKDVQLIEQLKHDPLLRRRAERVRKDVPREKPLGAPGIKNARDAIGEQRMFALIAAAGMLPIWASDQRWIMPRQITGETRFDLGPAINNAVPYLFRNEIHQAALGYNLPRHIVGDNLPHDSMWLTFEGALPVRGGPDAPGWFTGVVEKLNMVVDAILISRLPGLIRFESVVAGVGSEGKPAVMRIDVPIGARFPEEVHKSVHQFLGLIAFLNSPYVETVKESAIPRGKKVKSHGRRIIDTTTLHVVKLRSSVHEAMAVERGEGPAWKGRWLVRGHYRAQWYPGTKTHKVIWIAPYLKGPEDAPMIPQLYDVVR